MPDDARPFHDYLREHRNGATHDKLSDMLQELVEAVAAEGKAGSVTLKVTVKPSDAGRDAVVMLMEAKASLPKPAEHGSIWFITPDHNLQRDDPKQARLPLRDLGAPAAARNLA